MTSTFKYFFKKNRRRIATGIWFVAFIVWCIYLPTVTRIEPLWVWVVPYVVALLLVSIIYLTIVRQYDR